MLKMCEILIETTFVLTLCIILQFQYSHPVFPYAFEKRKTIKMVYKVEQRIFMIQPGLVWVYIEPVW